MKKVIIRNLKEFFEQDFNHQFKILADLEERVQTSETIEQNILIPYSNSSDAIFELIKIDYSKKTIFTYHFSNTIS
jgi:hypothetical protein